MENDASSIDHAAQAGLYYGMGKGADRLCHLVKRGCRFAPSDVKTYLIKVLPYYPQHKGAGIGLLKTLNAPIG